MPRDTPTIPTPNRRHRTLPRWKRNLFRLVAVLIPVLGMEAAARVYWVQFVEPPKTNEGLYEEMLGHKVLGDEVPYQFHPNREFTVSATPTRTNNLALRGDDDVDLSEPYEGKRILCIGDSVTFGYTVSGNETTYPAVLEDLLQEQRVDCQVLNAGMPRFRIQHLATMFEDQFRHYQASTVVILGGWNNANDRVLLPAGKPSWLARVKEHWYTLRVIRHWDFLPQLGSFEHVPATVDQRGIEDYAESLKRLIGLIRATGAQPIVCTLPHFFHNLPDQAAREKAATFTPVGTLDQLADAADRMNETIRAVAASSDVPLIELTPIAQHELFGDAIHPNDAGSRAIAERVAAFLLSAGVVTAGDPVDED